MKINIPNRLNHNLYAILREAGYMPIHDRTTGKDSYTRKLSTGHYPRFHVYVTETFQEVVFDLHLDQTESRHEGQAAHNADYDSKEVQQEIVRLERYVKDHVIPHSTAADKGSFLDQYMQQPAPKKSWLDKLLGK